MQLTDNLNIMGVYIYITAEGHRAHKIPFSPLQGIILYAYCIRVQACVEFLRFDNLLKKGGGGKGGKKGGGKKIIFLRARAKIFN